MLVSLVVMATGGTGGHIYPAVATAKELIKRGHQTLFMGQLGGMEERVTQQEGLVFYGVSAGKLARTAPDPREILKALKGFQEARKYLKHLRPHSVVGYGGFASLPSVLGAQTLGIPTVLHEQNARLGLTQRLAVHRAKIVGTSYPAVIGLSSAKARLVGMPVREARMQRQAALDYFGLRNDRMTILIMGGSQGSLFLNNELPQLLRWLTRGQDHINGIPIQVLHATGQRWLEQVAPHTSDLPWYKTFGFLDAIAAWSAADLAVTRAGTGTLAEAAFHGVPLLMVPLPESAENHQYHNAMQVQSVGAGRTIEQQYFREQMPQAVLECVTPSVRVGMREAAFRRTQPGAVARFADLIERINP